MNRAVGHFLRRFAHHHRTYMHLAKPGSDYAAVIVETRDCDMLYEVILNHMVHLGAEWKLHVFHGVANETAIKNKLAGWEGVTFHRIEAVNLTPEVFSFIMKNKEFWDAIPESHVLTFQWDSILFKHVNREFLSRFDMIGAPCGENTLNGGLCFRKKAAMLKAIEDNAERIAEKPYEAEDVFFTECLRADESARLPTAPEAALFSVESVESTQAMGAHGTDKSYMPRGTESWTNMIKDIRS